MQLREEGRWNNYGASTTHLSKGFPKRLSTLLGWPTPAVNLKRGTSTANPPEDGRLRILSMPSRDVIAELSSRKRKRNRRSFSTLLPVLASVFISVSLAIGGFFH